MGFTREQALALAAFMRSLGYDCPDPPEKGPQEPWAWSKPRPVDEFPEFESCLPENVQHDILAMLNGGPTLSDIESN